MKYDLKKTVFPSPEVPCFKLQQIKDTAASNDPNPAAFALAVKEVNRLLENDQFPRFKRSDVYVDFLEKLLPRAYAEKWTTSFEALLGNQVNFHVFLHICKKTNKNVLWVFYFRPFVRPSVPHVSFLQL